MRADLLLVMASVLAVALFVPPAVRAQADPAPLPAAEGLVPAAGAPVPAPVGETRHPRPQRKHRRPNPKPKPRRSSKPNSSTSCLHRSRSTRMRCSRKS